jgi:glutamyl-tRNA synthetase
MRELKRSILKHALLNAIRHGGRAIPNAVLSKIVAERPELRDEVYKVVPVVEEIVERVNSWGIEAQRRKLKELGVEVKRERKRYELPPLPDAEIGKVVTAFPPAPEKFPHLGHANLD